MKRLLLTLGFILLPALAMAATPDFNGAWVLNKANSDPAPNPMYWLTRSVATTGGGRGNAEVIIAVHQDAGALQLTDSQSAIHDYILDGKPHARLTETGVQKAVDTATLSADSLTIDTTQPFGGMPGNATLNIKQVWSLSPDGKTLTIATTRDLPARQQTYKQVYNWTPAQAGAVCSAGCVVLH